ncbi:UxaA family hydrolase [Paenibacillus sp. S150]|uniref:UxaA family hydrolase n=1 Tax=Paenibacillus sp. S150 TaxID=2749826 RepID=UPI001C61BD3E|nr:UxaA family hydrolase [Paenibacillus sp. S150]MBW4081031.1 UxaA family hydrolase [Paenibacillus sp. S150]
MHHFLIHKQGDQVGVATTDIPAGQEAVGIYMDDDSRITLTSLQDIPLGHKISLAPLERGGRVLEYGISIGIAPGGLASGEYVHTHNIKSARW